MTENHYDPSEILTKACSEYISAMYGMINPDIKKLEFSMWQKPSTKRPLC